ncbi:endonuclease domain-containing protein [Micromonospora sp. NPDC005173]|uniref:endonuclease domain-containing protein n=1 Tax=Micromonospora sp. NPDC005173 TaxID=3157165 RepID=UPI0033B40292
MAKATCVLCADPHVALGLCYTHYWRYRAIGDPLWEEDLCSGCGKRRGLRNGELLRCRFCPGVAREECTFGGCSEPVRWNRLCNGHAQQFRKRKGSGRPLEPLRPRRRNPSGVGTRDIAGRKRCVTCEQWKSESEFSRQALVSDGLDPRCRTCANRREVELKYKMPEGGYVAMVAAQNGRCAICASPPAQGAGLVVDHDHSCCPYGVRRTCGRCVRGLLCGACNSALGMLREDVAMIARASVYVSGGPATKTQTSRESCPGVGRPTKAPSSRRPLEHAHQWDR